MDAAFIGMLGALLVLLLSKALDRLLEMRRRHDRTIDLLTALHAEISAGIDAASLQTDPEEARYAEENATPFAPADDTDFVFESIKSDMSLLPFEAVHEIVLYYKLAMRSNLYTSGTTHPVFLGQSPEERRKYMNALNALLREQESAGLAALSAIERAATRRYGTDLGRRRLARNSATVHEGTDRTGHGTLPSGGAKAPPLTSI